MTAFYFVLYLISAVLSLLAALNVAIPKPNLLALAFFFFVLVSLIKTFQGL